MPTGGRWTWSRSHSRTSGGSWSSGRRTRTRPPTSARYEPRHADGSPPSWVRAPTRSTPITCTSTTSVTTQAENIGFVSNFRVKLTSALYSAILRGGASHQVASAMPDRLVAAVGEDAPADGGDVDIAVALDHIGEGVAHSHHSCRDKAVEPGQAQPVADVEEVGRLVGDHNRRAGLRNPGHFAKRFLGVVEVVEAAVAQNGVELPVAKWHVLGFAQDELKIAPGVAPLAGRQLGGGKVDSHDRPVSGQPARVDPVADGDVKQANAGGCRQPPQDDVARPPLASVEAPEQGLPGPDLPPLPVVVEIGRDLVVAGRGVAGDQHAIPNREARAARPGAAGEAGVRPGEGSVAARAADRSGVRPGSRRFARDRRHGSTSPVPRPRLLAFSAQVSLYHRFLLYAKHIRIVLIRFRSRREKPASTLSRRALASPSP